MRFQITHEVTPDMIKKYIGDYVSNVAGPTKDEFLKAMKANIKHYGDSSFYMDKRFIYNPEDAEFYYKKWFQGFDND
jgi:hypothetical protein